MSKKSKETKYVNFDEVAFDYGDEVPYVENKESGIKNNKSKNKSIISVKDETTPYFPHFFEYETDEHENITIRTFEIMGEI